MPVTTRVFEKLTALVTYRFADNVAFPVTVNVPEVERLVLKFDTALE